LTLDLARHIIVPDMSAFSTTSFADAASIDPDLDRPDDFAGPPITAAEGELLAKLVKVSGHLALEAAERVSEASQAERAVRATGASAAAASKALDQATERFELFSRAVRLTIGLKAQLVMDLQSWRKRAAAAATAGGEQRAAAARERRQAQQQQASEIVQEIVAKSDGRVAAVQVREQITRWFAEREFEKGLPDLPVGEVVARLCRDLGRVVNRQDWQGRPWAADAEALFGRAAAPEAADTGQAKSPAEAAASDPDTTPRAPPEAASHEALRAERNSPPAEEPPCRKPPDAIPEKLEKAQRRLAELRRRGWRPGQNPVRYGL
jgi:hypothetical protein